MKLLLDTHVLLWVLVQPGKLSPRVVDAVSDVRNDVFVSAINIWELAIKASLGRQPLPADWTAQVKAICASERFMVLPVTPDHAFAVQHLPWHHRDPFDRMLVAQALTEGLMLVSSDREIVPYDVPVLW